MGGERKKKLRCFCHFVWGLSSVCIPSSPKHGPLFILMLPVPLGLGACVPGAWGGWTEYGMGSTLAHCLHANYWWNHLYVHLLPLFVKYSDEEVQVLTRLKTPHEVAVARWLNITTEEKRSEKVTIGRGLSCKIWLIEPLPSNKEWAGYVQAEMF